MARVRQTPQARLHHGADSTRMLDDAEKRCTRAHASAFRAAAGCAGLRLAACEGIKPLIEIDWTLTP